MDLNALIYSDNASNIQVVVSAKDLRDFADSLMAFATQKIKERDEPTYYTREELEELLHCSTPTLLSYRRQGLIPEPVTMGGKTLYDKAKVREAMTSGRLKVKVNRTKQ